MIGQVTLRVNYFGIGFSTAITIENSQYMAHTKTNTEANAFVHTIYFFNSLIKQKGGHRYSEDIPQLMMQSKVLPTQRSPFF